MCTLLRSCVYLLASLVLVWGQAAKTVPAKAVAKEPAEAPGRWIMGTIGVGRLPDGTAEYTALKGLALKLGDEGKHAIAYDLELARVVGGWSGKFVTEMNLMSRGEYPSALGQVYFTTDDGLAGFLPGEKATQLLRRKGYGHLGASAFRIASFEPAGNFLSSAGVEVDRKSVV